MSVASGLATVVSVPRLFVGETAVIIGGGSSLTFDDVAYCRGKARVIAIKEAGCCRIPGKVAPAPWADVLYAADEKYWRFVQGAPEFTGMKYAIQQEAAEARATKKPLSAWNAGEWAAAWPDVKVLRDTELFGLELDPTGLRAGYNSGYQAINLAVHLGITRVLLLGFDCWRGQSGHQNWFGPHHTHLESTYPIFMQAFATLVEPLKAAGIEVVNVSRFTLLPAFPRVPLEEALP